jgi:hypothetical protein
MTKKYGFSQKSLLAKADRDFDYTPLAEANGNKGKSSSDNLLCAHTNMIVGACIGIQLKTVDCKLKTVPKPKTKNANLLPLSPYHLPIRIPAKQCTL